MKQISVLKEVGKFLKLYRESKNVSIPELSSLSNLTEEEINKIETGEIDKYMFENAFANYAIRIYLKAMPGTEINKITL